VRLPVLLAGKTGVQRPWQWLITDILFHLHLRLRLHPSLRVRNTASKVALPSLVTILTPLTKIGLMLLLRRSV
jgi:hypothetical protein